MSLLPKRTAVLLTPGIEVRACRLHPFREIPEFMDVQCVLAVGIEALDGAGDADWGVCCLLAEGDDSAD